jgi:hypothetical protein
MSTKLQKVFLCLIAASLLVVTGTQAEPTYVGADACQACHSSTYGDVFQSGHPYKLNEVIDGVPPTYPFTEVTDVPDGLAWDSVTYVIGGYNWKARFLDLDGWIVTGEDVQWNFATEEWVAYHSENPRGTKPYDCGSCHTTGWVADSSVNHDDLSLHQDSLAGIWGTWTDPGVTCEGCHGPGSDHASAPSAANIGDVNTETCGQCHRRNDPDVIDVSGGLLKHHEQFEEILLLDAPHNDCMTCHDPHKSTVNDLGGITEVGATCGSGEAGCHEAVTLNPALEAHGEMACYSCHMPFTAKSATKSGEGVHLRGDMRGHRTRIAVTETVAADTMFTEDGSAVAGNFITLDFACLQCHNGTDAPQRDMAWAAATAKLVHAAAPQEGYAGADACQGCHSAIYDDVFQSGHPYKLNEVVEGTPPTYPFTEVLEVPQGLTWDSVSYVIGGYNWKARFLDLDGWIVTGTDVQWNFATEEWVAYHDENPRGTKPYNCGSCHTTGWVPDETPNHDNLSMHQDGLPGIWGTWSDPGVTCEGCHGPGAEHASGPSSENIGDVTTETCGQCHRRNDPDLIDVSGGLLKHHEQYEEILLNNAPHDDCMTCHDPHKSAANDLGGVTDLGSSCGSGDVGCHADVDINQQVDGHEELACYSCHMPFTAKSATKSGEGVHLRGDMRGHRTRIAVSETVAADTMFTESGTAVAGNFITLDFACLQCHNGTDATQQDMLWAASNALSMHDFTGPHITAVKDVPNDQGGRVIVSWDAAAGDVDVNELPKYSVWRALPQGAAKPSGMRTRVARIGQVEYTWGWLADLPALKLNSYYYVAKTLSDSTSATSGMQAFMVVAHSVDPDQFGLSDVALGYSVDNLAPIRPMLRPASSEAGKVALHWAPNPETDLQSYMVYRGEQANFATIGLDPIGVTRDTSFVDVNPLATPMYYVVAAADIHENVSAFSNEVSITPLAINAAIPDEFSLSQNAPNPFNPSTTIRFALPEAASVSLVIYNQSGQAVRSLLDENRPAGFHDIEWDAKDNNGSSVASGVYIYRLESNLGSEVRRMLLVR